MEVKGEKHLGGVIGAIGVLADIAHWLGEVVDVPEGRLFLAGDAPRGETTEFVPSGFRIPAHLEAHRVVTLTPN